MTNSSSSSSSGGIGLGGAVFLVFLVLKLTGYIAWSWWWVTAPLWIPVVLVVAIFAIGLLIVGSGDVFRSRRRRIRARR